MSGLKAAVSGKSADLVVKKLSVVVRLAIYRAVQPKVLSGMSNRFLK